MTLYRQIVAMTLLFFSILLALVYSIEFTYTRDYLSRQMDSDVQNTVTTLGLSLVPHLQSGDDVAIESVVNAVFDGGYYKSIEVELLSDGQRINRLQPDEVEGVPSWFTSLQLFQPIQAEQVLTSGWLQLGELRVRGHVGYAYQQLWTLMSQMLIWFIVVFVAFWILLRVGLKRLLKPLRLLEQRSAEIENQQFGEPLPEPEVGELKGLVSAFNRMSQQLGSVFRKQAEEADELRRKAFQDDLTGLGNRSFFDGQMEQWLAEPGAGAVMLLAVPSLERVYREEGYQARDQLICALEQIFSKQVGLIPGGVLARVSGREFGAILPGIDSEQAEQMAMQILRHAEDAIVDPFGNTRQLCCVGAVLRQPEATPSLLFSQADLALQQATRDPSHPFHLYQHDHRQLVLGREGWKMLALQAMEHDWVGFQIQAVSAVEGGGSRWQELFAFIEKDGVRYAAGQFMPFVEQFQLGAQFDRYVLTRLRSVSGVSGLPLMINLSGDSIADAGFVRWLKRYLSESAAEGLELVVEVPEECVVRHYESLKSLLEHCRELRVSYGIDRFGHYFDKLAELAALKPDYIKMDISYLCGDSIDAGFVKSLATLSESQGIEIIASRVESDAQLQRLRGLPVAACQGYITPPRDI